MKGSIIMKHFTHYQIAKLTNAQRKAEIFQMTEDCIYISQKNHCDINAHARIYFVRESLSNYYDHNPVTIYDFLQMQTKLETLYDLMSCGLVREQKHEED